MLVDVKFTLLSRLFSTGMQNLLIAKGSSLLGWQLRGQLTLFIRASGLSDRRLQCPDAQAAIPHLRAL